MLIIAVGFSTAACGADGTEPREADIRRWRESGRFHFDVTRDLDRAIAAFESLKVARPEDPEALVGLGQALASAPRQWSRAAELFEAAIEVEPTNVDAHSGLFDATVRLGDLETAARVQERFARQRPDHPYPYIEAVRLAWLQEDRTAAERALADLEEAFPGDRTVRAWASEERARIALVDGRLQRADGHFADALTQASARGDPVEIIERTVDRAWALVWWSADTVTALAMVDSVIRAYPMASMPMGEWPFHYVAEFQALAGRPGPAVRILESHANQMDPTPGTRTNPCGRRRGGSSRSMSTSRKRPSGASACGTKESAVPSARWVTSAAPSRPPVRKTRRRSSGDDTWRLRIPSGSSGIPSTWRSPASDWPRSTNAAAGHPTPSN
ncbi:MAG: tetratricopeptide repeat protein [Gemmatimonadota bacterium]